MTLISITFIHASKEWEMNFKNDVSFDISKSTAQQLIEYYELVGSENILASKGRVTIYLPAKPY